MKKLNKKQRKAAEIEKRNKAISEAMMVLNREFQHVNNEKLEQINLLIFDLYRSINK